MLARSGFGVSVVCEVFALPFSFTDFPFSYYAEANLGNAATGTPKRQNRGSTWAVHA